MPAMTAPLQAEGALVDVRLGWAAARVRQLRRALQPIPPPADIRALIDSGAECTCLDTALIRQLGLPLASFGIANVPSAGGLLSTTEHDASLTVLHPSGDPRDCLILPDLIIVDLPIGQLGYQALIGRDVLDRCKFLYDGPAREFRLEY